jgi:CPA1 family monovalent cation:H+ antiporter
LASTVADVRDKLKHDTDDDDDKDDKLVLETSMGLNIEKLELLLLIAAVVAMLARRFRVPYSVGLVAAGIAIALFPFAPEVALTKELVFTALLPPLVFEAALYINWKDLRKDLPVVLMLATVGVVLSAAVTAIGMRYLVGWEWVSAMLFGVLIAATDPVSVIATFKEAGVRGRLRLLVEAESLFNDSTAAVGFSVVVAAAAGAGISAAGVGQAIAVNVIGGVVSGAAVASGVLLITRGTNDHLIEISFTTVAAYGSFLLAEHFHCSGVLAALTAGLMIGNIGSLGSFTVKGREAVLEFWEYVAFVANSLVFILIGMRDAHQNFVAVLVPATAAIGLVMVGRALAIYPCCLVFVKSQLRVEAKHQHILFWGGLRGALALALALGLPRDIPRRVEIVTVSFAVVAFSVFAQGLTITPLLRRLGEIPKHKARKK